MLHAYTDAHVETVTKVGTGPAALTEAGPPRRTIAAQQAVASRHYVLQRVITRCNAARFAWAVLRLCCCSRAECAMQHAAITRPV